MDVKSTDYLQFVKVKWPGKKTYDIEVLNKDGSLTLGYIKWWGPWWTYTFHTISNIVLDPKCLNAITSYINQLMEERKL